MLKRITLWIMAAFYVLAGIRHFTHLGFYLQMMPPFVPWHLAAVYVSGAAEIALGLGLLIPRLSRAAAWGVIALLIAVFPANIYMWTSHLMMDGKVIPGWFHAIRLPAQALLIAWAWWYTAPAVEPARPLTPSKSF
jgi:uncharacterized membrane protein